MNTPKKENGVAVAMLRNYCPDGNIEGVDGLGRLPKGSIVELPTSLANDLVKKGIASRDAAISDE